MNLMVKIVRGNERTKKHIFFRCWRVTGKESADAPKGTEA